MIDRQNIVLLNDQVKIIDEYITVDGTEHLFYVCPAGKFARILPGGRMVYTGSGNFGRLRIVRDYAGTPITLLEITSTEYATLGAEFRSLECLQNWCLQEGDAIVGQIDDTTGPVLYAELFVEEIPTP